MDVYRCIHFRSYLTLMKLINFFRDFMYELTRLRLGMITLHRCNCPRGYSGDRCEILVDKCLSNPCRNGALCISLSLGYTCSCSYPWTGVDCSITTDACFPNPCLAYGTCILDPFSVAGYRCLCAVGFIGKNNN